jgi:uncharacterized protein (TIGR04255 family)
MPERLPSRIDPCPIVEAIFEVRFTSLVPWTTLPGMLFAQIRDKYPEQKSLPLAQVPEELRNQDPNLANRPLLQFLGNGFLVQAGPRLVSLATKTNEYPGWHAINQELVWLLDKLRQAGVVRETERIGVRYIDFFPSDVLSRFLLGVRVSEQPLTGAECTVTTVLRNGPLAIRLLLTNAAFVEMKDGPKKKGTVLDADAWFGALDANVFENGLERFGEAHQKIKELFFGLLRPEFLATMNPEYT